MSYYKSTTSYDDWKLEAPSTYDTPEETVKCYSCKDDCYKYEVEEREIEIEEDEIIEVLICIHCLKKYHEKVK